MKKFSRLDADDFEKDNYPLFQDLDSVPDYLIDAWLEENRQRILDFYRDEVIDFANGL